MNTVLKCLYIVCVGLFIYTGCLPETASLREESSRIQDGKYDSEFPLKPTSPYLEKILNSAHLVSVLTFYESYYFDEEQKVTAALIRKGDYDLTIHPRTVFEQPSSGTATLIYQDMNRVAYITCAHVVNTPDTIWIHYRDQEGQESNILKYYILRVRQTANVISQPMTFEYEILALDTEKDLAVIGKIFNPGQNVLREAKIAPSSRVLDLMLGKASELAWGSFVYILGFPRAKKMVSTAVVSSPDYDSEHSFLLDATLQRGISGGIIVAIRDGVPNFELVGMVKGISGTTQYALVPHQGKNIEDWESFRPYTGDIYIEKQEIVAPGLLYATSIETILSFLDNSSDALQDKGFNLSGFFK